MLFEVEGDELRSESSEHGDEVVLPFRREVSESEIQFGDSVARGEATDEGVGVRRVDVDYESGKARLGDLADLGGHNGMVGVESDLGAIEPSEVGPRSNEPE